MGGWVGGGWMGGWGWVGGEWVGGVDGWVVCARCVLYPFFILFFWIVLTVALA